MLERSKRQFPDREGGEQAMHLRDEDWFNGVFAEPDQVGTAEYRAIYEVTQEFSDDPGMVVAILGEFRDWANTLLARMQE